MSRYINITQKQREALNHIINHQVKPVVKKYEYKKYSISTRTLNCLFVKKLIKLVKVNGVDYYYYTERGRIVNCTNVNHNIDMTLGDYHKMIVDYNSKHQL